MIDTRRIRMCRSQSCPDETRRGSWAMSGLYVTLGWVLYLEIKAIVCACVAIAHLFEHPRWRLTTLATTVWALRRCAGDSDAHAACPPGSAAAMKPVEPGTVLQLCTPIPTSPDSHSLDPKGSQRSQRLRSPGNSPPSPPKNRNQRCYA